MKTPKTKFDLDKYITELTGETNDVTKNADAIKNLAADVTRFFQKGDTKLAKKAISDIESALSSLKKSKDYKNL